MLPWLSTSPPVVKELFGSWETSVASIFLRFFCGGVVKDVSIGGGEGVSVMVGSCGELFSLLTAPSGFAPLASW